MAESTIGLYKTELVWPEGPWRNVEHLELATADHVWWFNNDRIHSSIGYDTPVEHEEKYYRQQHPGEQIAPGQQASTKPSAIQYPAALRRGSLAAQRRWLQSYLLSVADRDLREFVDVRNPGAVARLFALAAERTAQTVNMHEMGERLEIKPHTVRSYLTLLERCFLVQELPSWTVGLSASSAKRPKLHVIDTGLASASLRADASKLGKLAVGGPLVESFVVSEIRKQAVLLDEAVQLAHYRDAAGREVDLVVERSDGSVIGIEVKSSAGASAGDAKGLRFLRDALGDRFVCGVVLHTGPFTRRMEDRIWATPIPALWGGVGTTA